MNRIKPLDGLRAFAVLGVVWIHIWIFFENIPFKISKIDINRVIAIVGNGVDLFFVISGFCMYLMYKKKYNHFSLNGFGQFVWGRWKRIAPAFYAAVVIYYIYYIGAYNFDAVKIIGAHFLFMHTVWDVRELAPPFWSLATEWHFYMVLPFLLWLGNTRKKFTITLDILMLLSFVARLWLFGVHQNGLDDLSLTDRIYVRFIEFGWGILACRFYNEGKKLPSILNGVAGFIIAFVIAYTGRIFMTTEAARFWPSIGFVFKALAEPIMTLGFALMILNVITSESLVSRFLMLRIWQFIGKISYSMYLWHWFITLLVSDYIKAKMGISLAGLGMSFLISILILVPVSWVSYMIFEQFYFKKAAPSAVLKAA